MEEKDCSHDRSKVPEVQARQRCRTSEIAKVRLYRLTSEPVFANARMILVLRNHNTVPSLCNADVRSIELGPARKGLCETGCHGLRYSPTLHR